MKKLFIIWVLIFIFVIIGWVKNISKLIDCNFEPVGKAEIVRCIGILPPVGAIVGWMDIEDK